MTDPNSLFTLDETDQGQEDEFANAMQRKNVPKPIAVVPEPISRVGPGPVDVEDVDASVLGHFKESTEVPSLPLFIHTLLGLILRLSHPPAFCFLLPTPIPSCPRLPPINPSIRFVSVSLPQPP